MEEAHNFESDKELHDKCKECQELSYKPRVFLKIDCSGVCSVLFS